MRVSRHALPSSQQSRTAPQGATTKHQTRQTSSPVAPNAFNPVLPDAQVQGTTGGEERDATICKHSFYKSAPSLVERPLTCEEAAFLVRVHPKTVKRMARNGELPGHFRFGRWFFYASELDEWMRTELNSSRHSCR